jgi:hypothetical protein
LIKLANGLISSIETKPRWTPHAKKRIFWDTLKKQLWNTFQMSAPALVPSSQDESPSDARKTCSIEVGLSLS